MRTNRVTRAVATGAMALGLAIGGAAAAQADTAPEPEDTSTAGATTLEELDLSSGHFAPAPPTLEPLAQSPIITAGDCKYRQAVDDAHVTRGEASVHGWWIHSSGDCPSTATSTVYLQAYWCDMFGCRWVTIEDGERSAGPGSSKRANARWGCTPTDRFVGWRGAVDVDLDWQVDPPGWTYSPAKNLRCTPS